MNRKKSDDNGTKRVSFPSIPQKWGCWYLGFLAISGTLLVLFAIYVKRSDGWFAIIELISKSAAGLIFGLMILFAIGESVKNSKGSRLEKRTARHWMLAEKIKWEVEGSGSNPVPFNELLEKQAFRLLEKHRPPLFSKICRRKSREYNKMIARELLCAMQINLRGELNNFDDELERRAFRALEKYR